MSYADIFSEPDSSSDLGITLLGAALLHIVLILGLTFSLPKKPLHDDAPQLEITLVQAHTEQEPDDAASEEQVTQTDKVLVTKSSKQTPVVQPLENEKKKAPKQKRLIGLPQPMTLAQERERLLAELSLQQENYQKRPRRKFLTANTREYKYATYMDAWRSKVERIGNLNYPEEAKIRNLTGSLVLDVAILPDGKLDNINVRRSSHHKALDDAAIRIVRLAAPYAPFPKNFRDEVDIIHITRTWKFQHGDRLTSQ
jgi:protein TonB